MSLTARLTLLVATLMLTGLLLLGGVVYDSYTQTSLQQEQKYISALNHNLAGSLSWLNSDTDKVGSFTDHLLTFNTEGYLFLLIDGTGKIHITGTNSLTADSATRSLLFEDINNNNESGYLYTETMEFIWAGTKVPDSDITLVTLHQEQDENLETFINGFGLPLIISSALMVWLAIWASLIIGALFKKLNTNKQELEEQAETIAEARDKALKANQAKSTFLANMSHEIRTPLTAIIGYSDVLLGSDQTAQERLQAINIINKSSQHVLHIINEILDLSKIEADKLEIEKLMVSPIKMLKEVSSLMQLQADEKGLLFNISFKTSIPETIVTDPTRIKQILLNLFSNAVKFTDKGQVRIDVSCAPEKQVMTFEVIDTGIGMTEEQCTVIFDSFKQADTSTTRKYGGTGLGLTLSRQLAEMLGGNIVVKSQPGEGSCFIVEINTGKLDNIHFIDKFDEFYEGDNIAPLPMPQNLYSGNVLLAEDTLANQQLLSMYLRKMGATVAIASNGQDAIDHALNENFDLVLMDLQMPIMNGLDATRALRAKGYATPIVALTANASSEFRKKCLDAGCEQFLTKPIDRTRFLQVVAEYLHPATLQSDSAPIISDLLEESPDVADLIAVYIEKLPAVIHEIKAAGAKSNWQALESLFHQLKGSGGNYGYPELSRLAASIEFQVMNKNKNEVDALIGELESYCQRIYAGKQSVMACLQAKD
jgi:signal transduction histidine kinase/CheY-like chemotaxis protein/HPt (histidine-containing phosphotransfer) domain-containing protein